MKNIKSQILNLLSSTPICVEELFDLNFKSDLIFKAINQLEAEGAVLVQKGEMAYIKLASWDSERKNFCKLLHIWKKG